MTEIALMTEQLEYLLQHLANVPGRVRALGVFPADLVPFRELCNEDGKEDRCLIANTDPRTKPGQHWLAFYYDYKRRTLYYFDSFGMPLQYYADVYRRLVSSFLRASCVDVVSNALQSIDTRVCGFYCVVYLHFRTKSAKALNCLAPRMMAELRDMNIITMLHKLMHKYKCDACPTVTTRQSQGCLCKNAR